MIDVAIVGGGLAGAATALCLAKRGVGVVVVDKAEFPRDKPCGEGLLPHGIDLLREMGLGEVVDEIEGQPFRGILYRCHGVVARGDFANDATGRGVRRRLLDDAVRRRAAAAGVELRVGAVREVRERDAAVELTLADGSVVRSRVAVGADGPRSVVRHALGLDGGAPRKPRYAVRRHFRLAASAAMPERVEVNVVHGYELYVTPVAPGVVGVAALCEKSAMEAGAGKPEARLDALIAACPEVKSRLDGATPEDRALACGPLRVRSRGVGKGRVFLVGDAAGYVDAITGEGMSLALGTAVACAAAIESVLGGADVDKARARYAQARARAFRDHALLTFGLVELARRPWFAKRAIARLAKEPALFTRLLAVNNGTSSLTSLGVMDFAKLAVGASPPGA
jgi:flavin-dependent dehydrogenase